MTNPVIAVIPARQGSKGITNKNIQLLGEHPLLAYTIHTAKQSQLIDKVIVSTDSQAYADIAEQYGAEVPGLRPGHLATDDCSDYHVIAQLLSTPLFKSSEIVIHLRPTTPFRDANEVDKAIKRFQQHHEATALRSVHAMTESAYKTCEINGDYLHPLGHTHANLDALNLPRQQFPTTYQPNGYVDIIRCQFVREHQQLHGNKVLSYITEPCIEIDDIHGLNFARYYLEQHPIAL